MLITKNETEDDFTFIFKTVRNLSFQLFQYDYTPTELIADAAEAITNGFENVFELNKRITCWAHVERKIKECTNGIPEQDLIKADFYDLQSNVQEKHFDVVMQLLENKWRTKNDLKINYFNEFLNYFKEQWLTESNKGWFEDFAKGYPSTNNALESTNNVIKEEGTLRERLSLSDFVKCIVPFIENRSKDWDSNFRTTKKFALKPTIETKDWPFGYERPKLGKRIVKYTVEEKLNYMFTSSKVLANANKEKCKDFFAG